MSSSMYGIASIPMAMICLYGSLLQISVIEDDAPMSRCHASLSASNRCLLIWSCQLDPLPGQDDGHAFFQVDDMKLVRELDNAVVYFRHEPRRPSRCVGGGLELHGARLVLAGHGVHTMVFHGATGLRTENEPHSYAFLRPVVPHGSSRGILSMNSSRWSGRQEPDVPAHFTV